MKKPSLEKTGEPKKRGRPVGSKSQALEPNFGPPGKKAKPPKEAKEKAEPKVSKAEAAKAAAGHNSADPKVRELFLHHQPKVEKLRDDLAKANSAYRQQLKEAKGDGFEKYHFDIAREVSTPEGEAEYISRVSNELRIAQYMGAAIGSQLDIFAGFVDRTPIAERAYSEGQKTSMEGKSANPPYDPSTEAHREFMRGYHDHQATLMGGFKKTEAPVPPAPSTSSPVPSAAAMGLENDNDADDDFGDDDEPVDQGEYEPDDGDFDEDDFEDEPPSNVSQFRAKA